LSEYLAARRRTIEGSIATEQLAGNTFKEACERAALAEITALECAVASGEIRETERRTVERGPEEDGGLDHPPPQLRSVPTENELADIEARAQRMEHQDEKLGLGE